MLAGGIPTVLEFVSSVLFENTVANVDCTECTSEKVDDSMDEEHVENSGAVLALSFAPASGWLLVASSKTSERCSYPLWSWVSSIGTSDELTVRTPSSSEVLLSGVFGTSTTGWATLEDVAAGMLSCCGLNPYFAWSRFGCMIFLTQMESFFLRSAMVAFVLVTAAGRETLVVSVANAGAYIP